MVIDGASTTVRWVSNTTMEVDWVMTPTWGIKTMRGCGGSPRPVVQMGWRSDRRWFALEPRPARSANDLELVGAEVLLDGTLIPAPLSSSHRLIFEEANPWTCGGPIRRRRPADIEVRPPSLFTSRTPCTGPDPMVLPLDAEGAWSGELDQVPSIWVQGCGGSCHLGRHRRSHGCWGPATENPSLGSFLIDTESLPPPG